MCLLIVAHCCSRSGSPLLLPSPSVIAVPPITRSGPWVSCAAALSLHTLFHSLPPLCCLRCCGRRDSRSLLGAPVRVHPREWPTKASPSSYCMLVSYCTVLYCPSAQKHVTLYGRCIHTVAVPSGLPPSNKPSCLVPCAPVSPGDAPTRWVTTQFRFVPAPRRRGLRRTDPGGAEPPPGHAKHQWGPSCPAESALPRPQTQNQGPERLGQAGPRHRERACRGCGGRELPSTSGGGAVDGARCRTETASPGLSPSHGAHVEGPAGGGPRGAADTGQGASACTCQRWCRPPLLVTFTPFLSYLPVRVDHTLSPKGPSPGWRGRAQAVRRQYAGSQTSTTVRGVCTPEIRTVMVLLLGPLCSLSRDTEAAPWGRVRPAAELPNRDAGRGSAAPEGGGRAGGRPAVRLLPRGRGSPVVPEIRLGTRELHALRRTSIRRGQACRSRLWSPASRIGAPQLLLSPLAQAQDFSPDSTETSSELSISAWPSPSDSPGAGEDSAPTPASGGEGKGQRFLDSLASTEPQRLEQPLALALDGARPRFVSRVAVPQRGVFSGLPAANKKEAESRAAFRCRSLPSSEQASTRPALPRTAGDCSPGQGGPAVQLIASLLFSLLALHVPLAVPLLAQAACRGAC